MNRDDTLTPGPGGADGPEPGAGIDLERRRALTLAASAAGGAATAAAAWPFLASMAPSERARALAAPVEVDISGMRPGELMTVEWRGKPVWVLLRTHEMLRTLGDHDAVLADPESRDSIQPAYCRNPQRSIKPEVLVTVALCTHLGCIPSYRPEGDPAAQIAHAGFYCPCHGSKFDIAARVYRNVPAPTNLVIPRHKYLADTRILVGEDGERSG
jgi:ubiquinol-cytochrome c reductase iron-sulfur subunit